LKELLNYPQGPNRIEVRSSEATRRIPSPEPVSFTVKASSEEPHNFQAGDRVRVTEDIYATFPGGTYGEIIALNGRQQGYRDDILVKGDGIEGRGCFKPSEIVLVPKVVDLSQIRSEPDLAKSPSESYEFQVGNRVRVTNGTKYIPNGTYGEVISLSGLYFGQKRDLLVKLDNFPDNVPGLWSCDSSSIVLVPVVEIADLCAAPERITSLLDTYGTIEIWYNGRWFHTMTRP